MAIIIQPLSNITGHYGLITVGLSLKRSTPKPHFPSPIAGKGKALYASVDEHKPMYTITLTMAVDTARWIAWNQVQT